MPFTLVFVGLVLIVSGVRDTQSQLGKQVAGDFTGSGNFVFWLASLGAVGALGYVPELKKFSIAFMTLIIIAMILAQQKDGKGGFFATFYSALQSGPTPPAASGSTSAPSGNSVNGNAALNTGAAGLSQNVQSIGASQSANEASHLAAVLDIVKTLAF